jgi:glyoxylase-like metal-dependent hydrolase (beta-lactamase superfamily II)
MMIDQCWDFCPVYEKVDHMSGAVENNLTPNPQIQDLGNSVFAIDTMMGGHEGITSSYLIASDKPSLIETGSALCAPVVIESLRKLGIGRSDLASIIVTHIHLDHAGGVGDLAKEFPTAEIVVHERGARHLVDPTKLVASAYRVFGPKMDEFFGPLIATDATRIHALGEKDRIDLGGGRYLESFHNPGHASHHVALIDSESGDLYTGDAAGVYIPETGDIRPATPPPDFDFNLAQHSLAAMKAVQPRRLLFSHFGPAENIDEIFDESIAQLNYWVEWVAEAHSENLDLDHAILMVKRKDREINPRFYENTEIAEKFEDLSSTAAQVSGIWRWLENENQKNE